jgi:hypothetical protein
MQVSRYLKKWCNKNGKISIVSILY